MFIVIMIMINIIVDKKAEEDVSFKYFIHGFIFSDESLKWETIEQYFLWQLITAHNIPIEHMLPVLPMLEFSGNHCFFLSLWDQGEGKDVDRIIVLDC